MVFTYESGRDAIVARSSWWRRPIVTIPIVTGPIIHCLQHVVIETILVYLVVVCIVSQMHSCIGIYHDHIPKYMVIAAAHPYPAFVFTYFVIRNHCVVCGYANATTTIIDYCIVGNNYRSTYVMYSRDTIIAIIVYSIFRDSY